MSTTILSTWKILILQRIKEIVSLFNILTIVGLYYVADTLYALSFESCYFTKNTGDKAKVFYMTGEITYLNVTSSYFYDDYYS